MGVREQRKGTVGEREVVRLLRRAGLSYIRNLGQFRGPSEDDLVSEDWELPPIQVKNTREGWQWLWAALQSPSHHVWAIKIPRRGWILVGPPQWERFWSQVRQIGPDKAVMVLPFSRKGEGTCPK